MAELPKDESPLCSAFLFQSKLDETAKEVSITDVELILSSFFISRRNINQVLDLLRLVFVKLIEVAALQVPPCELLCTPQW